MNDLKYGPKPTRSGLDEARLILSPQSGATLSSRAAALIRRLVAEIEAERGENSRLRGEIGDAIYQIGSGWLETADQTLRNAITLPAPPKEPPQ